MVVLIRTSDVPAADRYDAWRSIVCDTLGPLDFRSDPDVPLSGEIEAGHLGPVNVGRVQTSTPHSVHRTPGLIRRGSSELYRVVLAISGNPRLEQDGRAAQLRPGEFAIYDFARPYELAYDSASSWRCSASPAICSPSRLVRPTGLPRFRSQPIRGPARWPHRCFAGWSWTWSLTGRPVRPGCPR